MGIYPVAAIILSVFYGIVIGQNDAANSFGDWIGAKVGKVRTGLILCAFFAFLGALLEGGKVIKTIGGGIVPAVYLTEEIAVIGIIASVIWVFIASRFGLPISTTHSAVGGIGGIGVSLIIFGIMPFDQFNIMVIRNIAISWIITPLGSALLSCVMAVIVLRIIGSIGIEQRAHTVSKILLTISSSFVAYTWGANDVANSVALLVGSEIMSAKAACILGGISIGLGAIVLGHKVAETVGFGISHLTPILGVIADLSTALIINTFTRFQIPVSTTHALVGAIFGVGIARGVTMVNFKLMKDIVVSWMITPVFTGGITFMVYTVFHLFKSLLP